MGRITIEDMEFFAYHGHFEAERIVGNKFIVNLEMDTDTSAAAKSDQLKDALDYQIAYRIVQEEMEKKSFLLEHLAERILAHLYQDLGTQLQHASVKISKLNPPMGGKIGNVSVKMER